MAGSWEERIDLLSISDSVLFRTREIGSSRILHMVFSAILKSQAVKEKFCIFHGVKKWIISNLCSSCVVDVPQPNTLLHASVLFLKVRRWIGSVSGTCVCTTTGMNHRLRTWWKWPLEWLYGHLCADTRGFGALWATADPVSVELELTMVLTWALNSLNMCWYKTGFCIPVFCSVFTHVGESACLIILLIMLWF